MLFLQLTGLCSALWASPQITEEAKALASGITSMEDPSEPYGRLIMAMAAIERKLDENALFVLAGSNPDLVEMIKTEKTHKALEYLINLPPTYRNGIRRGNTILRTPEDMFKSEWKAAKNLLKLMNFKKKKFKGIRLGAFNKHSITIELNGVKNDQRKLVTEEIVLAWPNTPIRDEQSRNLLTKIFDARPRPPSSGPGTPTPIREPSFEADNTLKRSWGVQVAESKPQGTVDLDPAHAFDGMKSIRFFNTIRTNSFPKVVQWQEVTAGQKLQVVYFVKGEKLTIELQQKIDELGLTIRFFDEESNPVDSAVYVPARKGSYLQWEQIQKKFTVPTGASKMQLQFSNPISGSIWFDALRVVETR